MKSDITNATLVFKKLCSECSSSCFLNYKRSYFLRKFGIIKPEKGLTFEN